MHRAIYSAAANALRFDGWLLLVNGEFDFRRVMAVYLLGIIARPVQLMRLLPQGIVLMQQKTGAKCHSRVGELMS